jgi:alkylresorcinol/alkylpyrone synthase
MASIVAVGTVIPPNAFSPSDVSAIAAEWLKQEPAAKELFDRFLRASTTGRRHFVLSHEQFLSLGGLAQRQEMFETHGPRLGTEALSKALTCAEIPPEAVGSLIFTSCSCPSIPAIDGIILRESGLHETTGRLPIYQHGCAGGVIGLQLANDLSRTRGVVALTSVELCSLVFQIGNTAPSQLVGASLFADGAATAVISPEDRGLVFLAHQSYLIPDSRHLMGYDTFDDGFHLRLDRDLPRALSEIAPVCVSSFLERHGVRREQIAHWLFHPGGVKILDFLESAFEIPAERCCWARDVLRTVGNLSSATILFVLKRFLDSKIATPGEKILMLGVGPGLTIELILFEWQGE